MIPNYPEKHGAEALFSPRDALDAQGGGVPDLPPAILLGFQAHLTDHVEERAVETVDIVRSQRCLVLSDSVGYVPVHEVGIGAPVAAIVTENVVASGAQAVVYLGGGASLQSDLDPTTAVLPTSAIRDEGVSYHYLDHDDPVAPTPTLVDALDESLASAGVDTARGPTWTTSAMYRETLPELRHYRDEGVLSLCMETAALWAVCRYRGVATATVHEVGDYLDPDGWVPESEDNLVELLDPTAAALSAYVTVS
ncbi:nucleoside phosphorylase [Halomarina salina]|uniref:Nucleoside phosphorylase n=1 Tax=Halomarina salina TaxID=1872699 RepID=A0ABD5RUR7_9EURY|nr:nucleoside phosphorylase [Halomarina salina]